MFKILTYFLILWQVWVSNSVTCPPYNPNVVVLFPHEYMCTWYYRCEQNGPVLMECWPPGTHFSPNTNRCEWESVANCTLSGVPPTTTTTVATTTISTTLTPTTSTTTVLATTSTLKPTTTTKPTTILPTTTTIPTTITSGAQTTTSSVFIVPTVPVGTTTTSRPTTSTTTTLSTTKPPPQCPVVDDPNVLVFLPNFEDCSAYFLCFNGEKLPRSCANGFFWDIEKNWCNVRDEVDCGSRGS